MGKKFFIIPILSLILLSSIYFLFPQNQFAGEKSIWETSGVSSSEIVVGSSLPLTGLNAFLGKEYLIGAETFFKKLNAEGGVSGRMVRLVAYDDQYIPAKTILNTQKLINDDKVFALINYVGSQNGAKVSPILEEKRIPLVGLFSGAQSIRNRTNRFIFNIRPSYYQETETFVKEAVDRLGFKRIAVFYQNDGFGFDGKKGVEIALGKRDLYPIVTALYEKGTMDVENAVEQIKKSGAQAVFMIATYNQAAKFVKLIRSSDYDPLLFGLSVIGPEQFAEVAGSHANGVVLTQVVPSPHSTSTQFSPELVQEYKFYLNKYSPERTPTFGGLEGYLNAKIFSEGLERAGADLTREKFVLALESLVNYDPGLERNYSLGRENRQGSDFVLLTYIKNNQFIEIDSVSTTFIDDPL